MHPILRLSLLTASVSVGAFLAGCGPDPESSGVPGTGADATHASASHGEGGAHGSNDPADGHAEKPGETHGDAHAEGETAVPKGPVATIQTSMGTIEVALDAAKAPITVKNFVSYAKKGHYNGTIFHRVIPTFMIQGGGMTPDMKEKSTDPPIKNEAGNGLKNERGTVAMARTGVVDSATSQFFINVENNVPLDHTDNTDQGFGYAVFGKVTKGMDVVDKIRAVKTTSKEGHDDVPVTPVFIQKLTVKE